jgi:hyperosmotically inducible protein
MNTLRIVPLVAVLLAGSFASFSAGCASTPTKESTGQYVDDSAITTKVKAAFVKDEMVKASEITVETYKGIVQLSGFVNTSEQKTRAAQIASGVPDVKSVKNDIQIK